MQTFFTYLAGAVLGGYLGALSQLLYLCLGIAGLPIFAGGKGGVGVLLGPTGGYLLGFIFGAFVIGKMAETAEKTSFLRFTVFMTFGTLVIYFFGVLHLSVWGSLSLDQAIVVGILPFVVGDVLKIVVAALLSTKLEKYLEPYMGSRQVLTVKR